MPRRILVLDTSILCCLLQIPGKDNAGPVDDRWDYKRVRALIDRETWTASTFVLPLATIIETGNHISQAPGNRFAIAQGLANIMRDAANESSPWAAFADQADLWRSYQLIALANSWPQLAASGLSIGDATIKEVAEYYAKTGCDVEILTADAGLKAYQPAERPAIPRRRR